MNCDETFTVLSGYLDGELDLVQRLEIERHLRVCQGCADRIHSARAVGAAMRAGPLYRPSPRGMEERVRSAIRSAEQAQRRSAPPARRFLRPALAAIALAALLGGAAFAGKRAIRLESEELLVRQVSDGHARSLMASHLLDTPLTDPRALRVWLGKRLDFTPPLISNGGQDIALLGGRLDYANDRPIAAFVYRSGAHIVNLFVWPATPEDPGNLDVSRRGNRVRHWTDDDGSFWAVSAISSEELGRFVATIRSHTVPGAMLDNCK